MSETETNPFVNKGLVSKKLNKLNPLDKLVNLIGTNEGE